MVLPERVKESTASTKRPRVLRLQIHCGTPSSVLQDVQSVQALSAGLPLPAWACLHQPEGVSRVHHLECDSWMYIDPWQPEREPPGRIASYLIIPSHRSSIPHLSNKAICASTT